MLKNQKISGDEENKVSLRSIISVIVVLLLLIISLLVMALRVKDPAMEMQSEGERIRLDFFALVWSASIAIAIGVIGLSGNCRYGISLKRLVNRMVGERYVILGGGAFLGMCPLAYIYFERRQFGLLGILCTIQFFILICFIWFVVWSSVSVKVKHFIIQDSKIRMLSQLKRICKGDEIWQAKKFMDQFLVSEMIEHIDVRNGFEREGMIEAVCCLFDDEEMYELLEQTTLENTALKVLVSRMIYRSGVETENERVETIGMLGSLWQGMMKNFEKYKRNDQEKVERRELVVLIQILVSLLEADDKRNGELFIRFWVMLGTHSRNITLIYILLYLEYRRTMEERGSSVRDWNDNDRLRSCVETLRNGGIWFDEEVGARCWIDWSQYELKRSCLGMEYYWRFVKDLDRIRCGKDDEVCSKVLKEIVGCG